MNRVVWGRLAAHDLFRSMHYPNSRQVGQFVALAGAIIGFCWIWQTLGRIETGLTIISHMKTHPNPPGKEKKMQYFETTVTGNSGTVTLVHTDRLFDAATGTWEDRTTWKDRHKEGIEDAKDF